MKTGLPKSSPGLRQHSPRSGRSSECTGTLRRQMSRIPYWWNSSGAVWSKVGCSWARNEYKRPVYGERPSSTEHLIMKAGLPCIVFPGTQVQRRYAGGRATAQRHHKNFHCQLGAQYRTTRLHPEALTFTTDFGISDRIIASLLSASEPL